jgi:hypothetical protein
MTNRQEVAKKLRENSTVHTTDEVYVVLLNCIGITYDYANLFNRLADLIDPTCEVALDEELSQELQGDMFRCDKCDAAFPRINGEYRYCPHCGARVVRNEA